MLRDTLLYECSRHHVLYECLPKDIPESIELDITSMQIGDVFHASDITLPANVTMVTAPERALVSVVEPKAEEEPAAAAPAEGEATEAAPAGGNTEAAPAAAPEKKD